MPSFSRTCDPKMYEMKLIEILHKKEFKFRLVLKIRLLNIFLEEILQIEACAWRVWSFIKELISFCMLFPSQKPEAHVQVELFSSPIYSQKTRI